MELKYYVFVIYPELKTLEWWISRSMLKLLVLLNPRLCQYAFDIQERSLKFNQSVCHVEMHSFENPVFISGVDGVISIELNID